MGVKPVLGTAQAVLMGWSASAFPAGAMDVLAGGTPNLDLNLRHESVDQDNLSRNADAMTLRARLGYTTARWKDFDAQLEFESTVIVGDDDFNSSGNGKSARPMVADPDIEEINQAWIGWAGLPATTLRYGRQRLAFDNQRILGNVGWRQNEQTYDAARLTTTLIPRTVVDYARITNVDAFRWFDLDPTAGIELEKDLDVKGHYLHATVNAIDQHLVVSPYALLLDFDEIPAPSLARQDTSTIGVRVTGAAPVLQLTLSYTLEVARQEHRDDAPSSVKASYRLVEPSLKWRAYKLTLGWEHLGGDGDYAFQTPLATLHAFQGWADQFLVTPADGIDDRYVSLGMPVGKAQLCAAWHDYRADRGSADYGSELDLLATYAFTSALTAGAKYANYSADEFPVAGTPARAYDTEKVWVWVSYKY